MSSSLSIRIVEPDNNKRGDLFGRLMGDLFVALGYELPRLNIHKSGREIDLSASHRLEYRRAVAECKATADRIGGDDVNKFVGALDAEGADDKPVVGYFISLSGFRETAIEQERQGRKTRIVLLTAQRVVEEMISGRALIPWERATELAGRLCVDDKLVLDPDGELLAHERGLIWAIYHTEGKVRTHVTLIHSDGTPLAGALAEAVIASDTACGGTLHSLTCRNPRLLSTSVVNQVMLTAYTRYLSEECGFIHLDGLPADGDVGSRKLRLESLFVPLHLDAKLQGELVERQGVGTCLENNTRLAILAAPGGGKSTLLKRLAIAYAEPSRRREIADDLPDRDWFPIFLRCRELRDLARGSFADIMRALSEREGVRSHAAAFREHVDRMLLAGRALILIDGLDEISDPGDRAAFVSTLRSALLAYPETAFVVTSREAGFRHVASHLAPICTHATLSPFDEADIGELCQAWHREVVGDTEKVRYDANELSDAILRTDRIRQLAINPLLLTTLLLVKRWVGTLPTRRAALYGKAVEVLLMTWNTEGHAPIAQEEALPQLCFVAFTMMSEGVQKISRPRLAARLREARDALPTELGYVQGTVEEFIHRVEDRSSLLMMSGHDVEDGQLVEFFEFRHLTFQEFLTARAVVEGWHPNRKESDSITTVLEPHLNEEKWSEVIPLAAVLGGKGTEGLIRRLAEAIQTLREADESREDVGARTLVALAACLADDAAARPETIRIALRELVLSWQEIPLERFAGLLARGKFGGELLSEARHAVFNSQTIGVGSIQALSYTIWNQTAGTMSPELFGVHEHFQRLLESDKSNDRVEGALGAMHWYYVATTPGAKTTLVPVEGVANRLATMLYSPDWREVFSACWGLAWLNSYTNWWPSSNLDLGKRLFDLAWSCTDREVRRMAKWALASFPVMARDVPNWLSGITDEQLQQAFATNDELNDEGKTSLLMVAWYVRKPWTDDALTVAAGGVLKQIGERRYPSWAKRLKELCDKLGIKSTKTQAQTR